MSWIRHLAATALACLLLAGLGASASRAEPIARGETWLGLHPQLATQMKQGEVRLEALDGSDRTMRGVLLPVRGGLVELPTARGGMFHEGALVFTAGGRSVKLRRIELDTTWRHLWGRSHGRRLRLASFERFDHSRRGYGAGIRIGDLRLARPLARLLARELRRPGVFRAGAPLGEAATNVQPVWNNVNDDTFDFSLDPGFFAKLEAPGVRTHPHHAETVGVQPTVYRSAVHAGRIYPTASKAATPRAGRACGCSGTLPTQA